MIKGIRPVGLLIGLLVSQVVSFVLALVLLVVFILIYGNQVLVAVFEYPAPVAVLSLSSVLAIASGGYTSMVVAREGIGNPLMVGIVSLVLNAWVMHYTRYVYMTSFPWFVLAAVALAVPASLGGGYWYKRQRSRQASSMHGLSS